MKKTLMLFLVLTTSSSFADSISEFMERSTYLKRLDRSTINRQLEKPTNTVCKQYFNLQDISSLTYPLNGNLTQSEVQNIPIKCTALIQDLTQTAFNAKPKIAQSTVKQRPTKKAKQIQRLDKIQPSSKGKTFEPRNSREYQKPVYTNKSFEVQDPKPVNQYIESSSRAMQAEQKNLADTPRGRQLLAALGLKVQLDLLQQQIEFISDNLPVIQKTNNQLLNNKWKEFVTIPSAAEIKQYNIIVSKITQSDHLGLAVGSEEKELLKNAMKFYYRSLGFIKQHKNDYNDIHPEIYNLLVAYNELAIDYNGKILGLYW